MKGSPADFFHTLADLSHPGYFLCCLFSALFLTLLSVFSHDESRARAPSPWFSIFLAGVGLFFYSLSFYSLSGQTLSTHRSFPLGNTPCLVLNLGIVLALTLLGLKIQKNPLLSLLKILCWAPLCVAVFFALNRAFQLMTPEGHPPADSLHTPRLLFTAALETTFLFWAGWLRKHLNRRFEKHFHKQQPLLPQGNTTTQFNPFSDEQDFLRSASAKLSEFKEFRILSAGLVSESDKSITLHQWSGNGEKEMMGKLSIPPQILEPLLSLSLPLQRFMLEQGGFPAELAEFFRQCTAWERCDFILPIHRNKKTAVVLFFSGIFPPNATNQIAPLLLDIHAELELLFLISETLQKERELQPLLQETRERKTSYESLSSKVSEIHSALSELQSKQNDLIQSERWISISQITVTLNHEINNPLTHVLGTAQLLKMKLSKNQTLSDAQFQQSLKSISEQCLRIVEIIKSLRRLSVPVVEQYLPEIEMIKLDLPPHD